MNNFYCLRTVKWAGGEVLLIDQNKLPTSLEYVRCKEYREVAHAIKNMVVRGAPAIGVAAAMGLALAAIRSKATTADELISELEEAAQVLRSTRPTGMNLFWATARVIEAAKIASSDRERTVKAVVDEAVRMGEEDFSTNVEIGRVGASVLRDGDVVLTHCNAGALATVGYGTALAAVRHAVKDGKRVSVIVTETRPRLQGARLTTYELLSDGIPVTLITDGMVAAALQSRATKVIVGADRVLGTGHVVNKIGTLTIAIAAKHFGRQFYVAAPISTFDLESPLSSIVIEERDPKEVRRIGSTQIAPEQVPVWNPAFDVTPPELVTGIITEKGILGPGDIASVVRRWVYG